MARKRETDRHLSQELALREDCFVNLEPELVVVLMTPGVLPPAEGQAVPERRHASIISLPICYGVQFATIPAVDQLVLQSFIFCSTQGPAKINPCTGHGVSTKEKKEIDLIMQTAA